MHNLLRKVRYAWHGLLGKLAEVLDHNRRGERLARARLAVYHHGLILGETRLDELVPLVVWWGGVGWRGRGMMGQWGNEAVGGRAAGWSI